MLDMGETFLVYVVADLQDRPCREHGAAALTIDEFNPAHFPEPPWWNPEASPAPASSELPLAAPKLDDFAGSGALSRFSGITPRLRRLAPFTKG
jgi:hypothetical protein